MNECRLFFVKKNDIGGLRFSVNVGVKIVCF